MDSRLRGNDIGDARPTEGSSTVLTTCRNAVFGEGVTVSVTFENKLNFFYIVLLQFIELHALYIECIVVGRTLYECESSTGASKSYEQANSRQEGAI